MAPVQVNSTRSRASVRARLSGYWKMEAANVLFVPGFTWWLADRAGGLGWAGWLACAAAALLLMIGAAYWWAKLRQIEGRSGLEPVLDWAERLRVPSAILTIAAFKAAIAVWVWPDFSIGRGDQWAAMAMAVLAVLEYVNYYHIQLQHFDNMADIRRLLSGRGFRESQMAADLKRRRAALA